MQSPQDPHDGSAGYVATVASPAGLVVRSNPDGSANFITPYPGMEVYLGDMLETTSEGQMRVALWDGSSISLGAAADITVVQHDSQSQQNLLERLLNELRQWIVNMTGGGSQSNPCCGGGGIIGFVNTDGTNDGILDSDLIYPDDTSATLDSQGEWFGFGGADDGQYDYYEYDSYDDVYYDYSWGGDSGGGGECPPCYL